MSPMTLNALLGLVSGAVLLLIGALLISLWYAGRELTPQGQRTDLGRALGWFCFYLGAGAVGFGLLNVQRWVDLSPTDVVWVAIPLRAISLVALVLAADRARKAGPMVLARIEEGRLV